jgi:hypothetical protein
MKHEAWFRAWRRSEAHGVPMTKEGMQRAEERAENFKKGYEYGVQNSITLLESEHSKVKKTHSFYLLASRFLAKLK